MKWTFHLGGFCLPWLARKALTKSVFLSLAHVLSSRCYHKSIAASYFSLTPLEKMILQLGRTASVTAHSVAIPCIISLFVDMVLVLLWNKSFQNLHDSENWTNCPIAGLGIVPLKGMCLSLCVKKKYPLQPGLETFTSWLECVAGQWGEWEM